MQRLANIGQVKWLKCRLDCPFQFAAHKPQGMRAMSTTDIDIKIGN